MVSCFRLDANPKQDSESGSPRQQEEPWMITDQDLERNKAKVLYTHNTLTQSDKLGDSK